MFWPPQKKVQYAFRKKGEVFVEKNTLPAVKHGGGSIMLWYYVAAGGTGNIVWVEERMDSTKYQEILEANVQRSVQTLKLCIPSRQWLKAYFKINHEVPLGKTILEWPPQSPEWNNIENLWRDIKHAVHARRPKNISELEVFWKEEWEKIPKARPETGSVYKLLYLPEEELRNTNWQGSQTCTWPFWVCPPFCTLLYCISTDVHAYTHVPTNAHILYIHSPTNIHLQHKNIHTHTGISWRLNNQNKKQCIQLHLVLLALNSYLR